MGIKRPADRFSTAMPKPLHQLPAHVPHTREQVHVVVETPKGNRNKVAFDPELQAFKLKGVLPEGHSFPYDFGFVPSTQAEDGDPLDVLLLLDAPTFPGCVVEARLIGALEIEQEEADGQTVRNDRLLAVAAHSRQHKSIRELTDLSPDMLHEIEHFFVSYNQVKGQTLKVLRRVGPAQAHALHKQALP
jgi:inorganic pyrophosphatase